MLGSPAQSVPTSTTIDTDVIQDVVETLEQVPIDDRYARLGGSRSNRLGSSLETVSSSSRMETLSSVIVSRDRFRRSSVIVRLVGGVLRLRLRSVGMMEKAAFGEG